jgi:hypothetical protein
MPEEFRDYASLLARLQALVSERSPRIIGIEGYMAAGKSHLAKQLAKDPRTERIEADDCSFRLLHPRLITAIWRGGLTSTAWTSTSYRGDYLQRPTLTQR